MPMLDNRRHELFAQEAAKEASGRGAYKKAGYKTTVDAAADVNASKLLRLAKVRERIAELQDRGAIRAEVTVQSVLGELEEARKAAMSNGQTSAAVAATMGKAKIAGLIIDRRERGRPGEFEDMSDEQLAEFIAREFAPASKTADASRAVDHDGRAKLKRDKYN